MKTHKIIREFMRSADNNLVARAINVAASMKGNTYFPNPTPPLQDLDAAILAFSTAMSAANKSDRLKLSLKNDAANTLRNVLSSLAYYVESVAQGDKTILISSGFKISKGVAVPPAVDFIDGFRVEHGNNSGEMKLSAIRLKGVNTYSFYFGIADGENTIYDHVTKTRVRAIISGLQVGKAYAFYMMAIGANEKFVKSVTIIKVVS